jgi:two-component system, NtrC family, response regulator PilR
MRSRILFVSQRAEDAGRLSHMLQPALLLLEHAASLQQARVKLREQDYDVLLTEAILPDGTWLDALEIAQRNPGRMSVVVTDVLADTGFWTDVLNLGAYDVLPQPFYAPEVRRILYNACWQPSRQLHQTAG